MKKAELWSKQTTVKVLADKSYGASYKNAPAFVFRAAKNEYESAQVILTAAEDIREYRVELAHIQSQDRKYYIWKDCFTVYHQKYIEVKHNSEGAEQKGFGKGLYPDALPRLKRRSNTAKTGWKRAKTRPFSSPCTCRRTSPRAGMRENSAL